MVLAKAVDWKKNGVRIFLASILAAFLLSVLSPIEAYAETRQDRGIADSEVTVNSDGSVTYKGDLATGSGGTAWTKLISKYRYFIAGISGGGAVSMILFCIINLVKLGASSANPAERSRAIMGLVFSGLAAAGLGAVTFIVGIFFNAL